MGDKPSVFYNLTGSFHVFSFKFLSTFCQLSYYIYKDIDKFLIEKSSSICKLHFLNIYIPIQQGNKFPGSYTKTVKTKFFIRSFD
jgi:hypothetical protein